MSVKVHDIPAFMREFANFVWSRVKDLLFPPRCPICDEVIPIGRDLCEDCKKSIRYVPAKHCLKCGKPLEGRNTITCKDCLERHHEYEQARSVFCYSSVAKSIYRFKYQGRQEYAKFYAKEIAGHLKTTIEIWNPDAIIPVPIHRKRHIKRGYNQAELIAKELSKITGIPLHKKLVKRCKNTKPLKLLNAQERQKNLVGSFKMYENDVKLKTTILIDDIYTTGSTVDAVARILKQSGVQKVYVITLAVGTT